jgi:hypothetical protein
MAVKNHAKAKRVVVKGADETDAKAVTAQSFLRKEPSCALGNQFYIQLINA